MRWCMIETRFPVTVMPSRRWHSKTPWREYDASIVFTIDIYTAVHTMSEQLKQY